MLTCLEGFAGRAYLVSACSNSISLYPPVTVLFRFKYWQQCQKLVPLPLHLQMNIVPSLCWRRCESIHCMHYKANTLHNNINVWLSCHTQIILAIPYTNYVVSCRHLHTSLLPRSLGMSVVIHRNGSMHCRKSSTLKFFYIPLVPPTNLIFAATKILCGK